VKSIAVNTLASRLACFDAGLKSTSHGQCFHQEAEPATFIRKQFMGIIGLHKTKLLKN
jgi:hypothetical protein